MFKVLLIKEMQNSIKDYRFIIVMLFSLGIVPLLIISSLNNYYNKIDNLNEESINYQSDLSKNKIDYFFIGKGYRIPYPLEIISKGLDSYLPHSVQISNSHRELKYKIDDKFDLDKELYENVDFVYFVSFFLSLLALLFSYNLVSGEKEQGTLKYMLANGIKRIQIINAKIIGGFLAFSVSFIIAFIISIIILAFFAKFNVFHGEIMSKLLLVLLISLLFIFTLYLSGVAISIFSKSSSHSILVSFFIWMFLIVLFPKIMWVIGEKVYQQETDIDKKIEMVKANYNTILSQKRTELMNDALKISGVPANLSFFDYINGKADGAISIFNQKFNEVESEMQQKLENDIKELLYIKELQEKKRTFQIRNLLRLSPLSCYSYTMNEICSSGFLEYNNFNEESKIFEQKLKEKVYSNWKSISYRIGGNVYNNLISTNPGNKIEVPSMDYKTVSLRKILNDIWIDIVLLCFASIVLYFFCTYRFTQKNYIII